MTIEYRREVATLDTMIRQQDYYVSRWEFALNAFNITSEEIQALEHDERLLIEMLNQFWFMLPDSPSIRTEPFFPLCDLCIS